MTSADEGSQTRPSKSKYIVATIRLPMEVGSDGTYRVLNEHLDIAFAPGEKPEGVSGSKDMSKWSAELRHMIQSMLPGPVTPDPDPDPAPTKGGTPPTIVLNDAIQVRAPATNVSFKSRSYGTRLSRKQRA